MVTTRGQASPHTARCSSRAVSGGCGGSSTGSSNTVFGLRYSASACGVRKSVSVVGYRYAVLGAVQPRRGVITQPRAQPWNTGTPPRPAPRGPDIAAQGAALGTRPED